MKTRKSLSVMSGICLTAGSLLYICFRPRSLLMFQLAISIGINQNISLIRGPTKEISHRLPEWIIYSLPFSLWVVSYMLAIGAAWEGSRSPARLVWLAIVPAMSIASEIAQAVHLIPGSFDWVDLVLLTTGTIIGAILVKANGGAEYVKQKNEESSVNRVTHTI